MAPQLPSEIIEHIVAKIPHEKLGPLLFVSKTLYHNAIRFLFRDVAFESYNLGPNTRMVGLFDILSANPLLVGSIQRARIQLRTPPSIEVFNREHETEIRAFAGILELLSGSPLKALELSGGFSPLGLIDDALSALLRLRRLPTLQKLVLSDLHNVPYSLVAGDPATDQLSSLFLEYCSLHVDKKFPPSPSPADGKPWKHVVTKTLAFPGGAGSPGPVPLSKLKILTMPNATSLSFPLHTRGMSQSALFSELLLDISDSDSDFDSQKPYMVCPSPFVDFPSLQVAHLGCPPSIVPDYGEMPGKQTQDVLRSMPNIDTLTLRNISMLDDDFGPEPILLNALPPFPKHLRNLSLHIHSYLHASWLALLATSLATSPTLPHIETLSLVFGCNWKTYMINQRCGRVNTAEPVLGPQHDAWKTCTDALTSGRFPSLRVFQVQIKLVVSTIPRSELAHTTLGEYLELNWKPELVLGSLESALKRLLGKDIEVVCGVEFDTERFVRR